MLSAIVASRGESPIALQYQKNYLELGDGDCLVLEWFGLGKFLKKLFDPQKSLDENLLTIRKPEQISIVLGNINGSNGDTYSRHTIQALEQSGHLVVFSHWRNSNWHDEREP